MSYTVVSALVCLGLFSLGLPAVFKACRDLDKSNENERRLNEAAKARRK